VLPGWWSLRDWRGVWGDVFGEYFAGIVAMFVITIKRKIQIVVKKYNFLFAKYVVLVIFYIWRNCI
jgi:hypothetical protein